MYTYTYMYVEVCIPHYKIYSIPPSNWDYSFAICGVLLKTSSEHAYFDLLLQNTHSDKSSKVLEFVLK